MARRARPCGDYLCGNEIEKGALYVRHVAFPGEEGHEYGTKPWVIEECVSCVDERLGWIRHRYDVPAYLGRAVDFDGKTGVIAGAANSHLLIRLGDRTVPVHPTWRVTYEEAARG